jgi:hypothetical protein
MTPAHWFLIFMALGHWHGVHEPYASEAACEKAAAEIDALGEHFDLHACVATDFGVNI